MSIDCRQLVESYTDPWITRYIFPKSMLPSAAQVAKAAEKLFVLEDVQNFGADYERTLFAWEKNFARSWDHLKSRYGERFYRMWRFYLLSCAGAFRARNLQVFQFLFSKGGTRYLPACATWLYPERRSGLPGGDHPVEPAQIVGQGTPESLPSLTLQHLLRVAEQFTACLNGPSRCKETLSSKNRPSP